MAKIPNNPSDNPRDTNPARPIPFKDLPPGGRFQPGHQYAKGGARDGAGRKTNEVKELERALKNNPKDIKATWAKMVAMAHAGNIEAIRLHLARVFGKEAQSVELSEGEDGKARVTIIVQ